METTIAHQNLDGGVLRVTADPIASDFLTVRIRIGGRRFGSICIHVGPKDNLAGWF